MDARFFILRSFGFLLIAVGFVLITYVGAQAFAQEDKVLSPVPDETGIQITFSQH